MNRISEWIKKGVKQSFTLIELISVIVVLGILAAIVIPNISSMKEDAIPVAVSNNERTLQTAVDMYGLDHNGALPTIISPTIEDPQPLNYDALYPKYLKSKPEVGNYLVDAFGKVWGSTSTAPNQIHYLDKTFTFKTVNDADGYKLLEYGQTENVNAKAATGKYRIKEFASLPNEGEELADIYRVDNPENKSLLVSAVDKYGLQTAPVGEEYLGNQDGLPITGVGSFFLITDANGTAKWEGIQSVELLPEGTAIDYSFATSNDNRTYSEFTQDITTLETSRYMKVKVDMTSTGDNYPTLKMLKVIFHLVGEDVTVHTPTTPVVLGPNETEKTFTEIVDFGEQKEIGSIDFIGKEKVEAVYQSSEDGITYSPPTFYPEELPDGQYVKIEIEAQQPAATPESPTVEKIVVNHTISERPKSGTVTAPPAVTPEDEEANLSEWETVTSLTIIEDATEIGDWVSVTTSQQEPAGTRMLYVLSTSNDESTWSEPVEYTTSINAIDEMENSRYLRVQVLYQRNPGVEVMPALESITIDYRLLDGTPKSSSYDKDGNPVSKEGRLANGSFIEFGEYNGKALYWNVIKEENGQTMIFMTPESQLFYTFDSGPNEGEPTDSGRTTYGSNNWSLSDVRQWLNGDFYNQSFQSKELIDEVTHEHIIGEIDKATATSGTEAHISGTSFSIEESLQNYDVAYKKEVTDKVFLINLKELVYDIHPVVETSSEYYATRDAVGDSGHAIRFVDGGLVRQSIGSPIRPALYLNGTDIFQYGDGTKENPYRANPVKLGGIVSYGNHNGHTLMWDIVKQEGNQVTLFMKEPLKTTEGEYERMPFSLPDPSSTYSRFVTYGTSDWEDSGIRNWLNGDFYDTAFSANTSILPTTQDYILPNVYIDRSTSGTQQHQYATGNSSQVQTFVANYSDAYKNTVTDKVYLVSLDEIANTIYPVIGSRYSSGAGEVSYVYWTRDARGDSDYTIRTIGGSGQSNNSVANDVWNVVRPAITIDASRLVDPDKNAGTTAKPYVVQ